MNKIINIHTHIFTFNHVPAEFVPLQSLVTAVLDWLPGLVGYLVSDRAELFLSRGSGETQEDILNELNAYYPSGSEFVIHSMDFEYMGAGGMHKGFTYLDQLEELALLKASPKWKDRIDPFFCADPRRPDMLRLAREYIEKRGFAGIKIYPALGFFPYDDRLMELYGWAEKNRIPIMTHCSRAGSVYFRGDTAADGSRKPDYMTRKEWADTFSAPDNYELIFETFPELKICFAHFGGEKDCMEFYKQGNLPSTSSYICGDTGNIIEKSSTYQKSLADYKNWFLKVVNMMKRYKGAFADISYTSGDEDLMALFHVYSHGEKMVEKNYSLKDKILFGSDFYMAHLKRNERWFSINLRSRFGEEAFWRLIENNRNYLFG